jgi:PAS domain S-box-containing protein
MPGLDAPTALAIVRGRQVDTPCIIVSGTVGEENAVAAMRFGAKDFVLKDNLARLAPAIERELRDSEVRIKHARAVTTLRAAEASLRGAFELIPDGVLVHRGGRVLHANSAAAATLGAADRDDLVGRSLLDLFAPSDREAVREHLQGIEASSAPTPLVERTMVRLDGGLVPVEKTGMPVQFDGEPAILSVIRDVSARRELVARTMQLDRMLAIGTLAAGVGHEINNPLASLMANVAYAIEELGRMKRQLESLGSPESLVASLSAALTEVVSILADVDEASRRIRDITRDLSTFARSDDEMGLVDVRVVADSALRMAAPETRHRARVVRRYDDVPAVRASASRLSQVFLNLVVNAAHAISKGASEANEIAVSIRSEGPNVVVEVRDTGSGIAPEHREHIFTPFFTTKPVGQGTGLGLSISKRIVCLLGGDIDVESTPGRGTTMRVILPAASNLAAVSDPASSLQQREG